ncbi:MAG: SUMF1/EgtB/PvdO family nonheme iron enzyme [Bacteroidia bacterium]|nr:SUMF1/EgtB/PvdO family nonheme iron enzyme [Bacteroidia bacterium]MDW8088413.1 SUMF1/EgtB/PvdO family nonheme iron enzyme [Bacteroidia bacterium]
MRDVVYLPQLLSLLMRVGQLLGAFSLAVLFLGGCGSSTGARGELTGVMGRPKWVNPVPLGMTYIPAGSFHMGNNEQDVNYSQNARIRQITISDFYMDDTEISNNEYRQFLNEVIAGEGAFVDSIFPFMERYYGKKINNQEEYLKLVTPDTLAWNRDFGNFVYNDPLVENYYHHPAFDDYPVVGVNWYAAQAFSYWRTLFYNAYRASQELPPIARIRLPTEAEWEYAARGGYEHKIYPWLGPYTRNSRGCPLANFKPGRGDYIADGFEYTSPVKSYFPNDYGLYNMAGNVAEWCEDDFEETGPIAYAHDINPIYRDPTRRNRRRVVRGGGWNDIAYFISVGTRDYEYADTAKCHIGFRCALSVIGRSGAERR